MSCYFIAILAVSALLVGIYFVVQFKNKRAGNLEDGIILIVSAAGMVSALKVMLKIGSVVKADDDRVFVFLGLVSMFWVSFQAALNIYNKK